MHKGGYECVIFDPAGYGFAGTGLLNIDFNCGVNYLTNAPCDIYENVPSQNEYDVICEDCFSLDESL